MHEQWSCDCQCGLCIGYIGTSICECEYHSIASLSNEALLEILVQHGNVRVTADSRDVYLSRNHIFKTLASCTNAKELLQIAQAKVKHITLQSIMKLVPPEQRDLTPTTLSTTEKKGISKKRKTPTKDMKRTEFRRMR